MAHLPITHCIKVAPGKYAYHPETAPACCQLQGERSRKYRQLPGGALTPGCVSIDPAPSNESTRHLEVEVCKRECRVLTPMLV